MIDWLYSAFFDWPKPVSWSGYVDALFAVFAIVGFFSIFAALGVCIGKRIVRPRLPRARIHRDDQS